MCVKHILFWEKSDTSSLDMTAEGSNKPPLSAGEESLQTPKVCGVKASGRFASNVLRRQSLLDYKLRFKIVHTDRHIGHKGIGYKGIRKVVL